MTSVKSVPLTITYITFCTPPAVKVLLMARVNENCTVYEHKLRTHGELGGRTSE